MIYNHNCFYNIYEVYPSFVGTNVIYPVERTMFIKLYLFYVQIVNASQLGECVHSKKRF